jgi:cytidine deaminase
MGFNENKPDWRTCMNESYYRVSSMPLLLQQLYSRAVAARELAFAPYSNFKVGAAIDLIDGNQYDGCNVENASYGMTICAERTAVVKAVSSSRVGAAMIQRVWVACDVSDDSPLAFPCGGCRSVLAQFSAPETMVFVSNLSGSRVLSNNMGILLPNSFEMQFTDTLAKPRRISNI